MSDDTILALERELLRSGKKLRDWAVEVLEKDGGLLEAFLVTHLGPPRPDVRATLSLTIFSTGEGRWVVAERSATLETVQRTPFGMGYLPAPHPTRPPEIRAIGAIAESLGIVETEDLIPCEACSHDAHVGERCYWTDPRTLPSFVADPCGCERDHRGLA